MNLDIILSAWKEGINSIFPEDYSVHKKDRNSEGGLFTAIRETIIAASMPNINVNCGVIWAGLRFSHCRPLYMPIYYGPHSNKQEALNELANHCPSSFINRSNMPIVIIGGDFYFADINLDLWSTTKPSTATYHRNFL